MPVTLLTLIKASPMAEETRQRFLANLGKMTEGEKEELSATCWTVLTQTYFAKLKYELEKYQLEVAQGKREYKVEDLAEIEKKLTEEYANKLESAQSDGSIEEVRQQLKKFQNPPSAN